MPEIKKHASIILADLLLDPLMMRWKNEGVDHAVVRHYADSREQGYHVSCANYSVSFAKRIGTASQVIIYWGRTVDFDPAGRLHQRLIGSSSFHFYVGDSFVGAARVPEIAVTAIINCLNYGHPAGVHPLEALAKEGE